MMAGGDLSHRCHEEDRGRNVGGGLGVRPVVSETYVIAMYHTHVLMKNKGPALNTASQTHCA